MQAHSLLPRFKFAIEAPLGPSGILLSMPEACCICHTRRPKRHCPGIGGDICPICCGDQREVNVSCPLDCEYLVEARLHERPQEIDRKAIPNSDVQLSEEFVSDHQELILFSSFTIADAALRTAGATDADVLSALEALIRTHRTLESGLVYETRAADRVAAQVQEHFEQSLKDFQKRRESEEGRTPYRNAEVLGALVFLERSALVQRNGRPRGRAFIDFLRLRLSVPIPQQPSGLLVS